ncbi:conserved exported hypothetical protein [Candidatus Terasakiella magnetica]|nr:conserved exported hypothetical protein [Candidatus Terasakiella magnetica]
MKVSRISLSGAIALGVSIGTAAADNIPEFSGPALPDGGWSYGQVRGDYWKHKADKALFSITAANVDQYADKLTPGQVALFKQKPDYRMDVYPTRRDCGYPDWVQANSKQNAASAKLDATGNFVDSGVLPGTLFPNPTNGAQILWNYQTRYRGVGVVWPKTTTAVSPRPGNSEWIATSGPQHTFYPWGAKGQNSSDINNGLHYGIYFSYNEPPALAGQGIVQRYSLKQASAESYYYFPGQRRVRRMPTYQYDAPQIGFENNYALDEPFLFNGPIDRFDWKVIGKKEMFVPYHSFAVYNYKTAFKDVAQDKYINPEHRHYELHRVIMVEGTAKPDVRHVAPKKVMYFDEDTFLALAGEDYDAQGRLWKVREGFSIPVWELGGSCDVEAFVQYDLLNGRYVFDQATLGAPQDIRWLPDANNDSRFTDGFFSSETLRAVSER